MPGTTNAAAAVPRGAAPMTVRDVIFWGHLAVGTAVGAVVLVLAVTGALMAFRPQILNWTQRPVRQVTVPERAVRSDLNALIEKAAQAFPGGRPAAVTVFSDPQLSVAVNLGREAGTVYVNPYSGQVLGKGSWMVGFMDGAESWHRWLAMTGPWKDTGHAVKSACTVGFLLLILSGIYLWVPRKHKGKRAKPVLAFVPGVQGRAKDWNQHNVIGIWSAPALMVMALTGIIMAYPWANTALFRLTGNEPPPVMDRRPNGKVSAMNDRAEVPLPHIDMLAARAAAHMPQWRSMNIRLTGKGPVQVSLEAVGERYPKRSQLTLDARSGEVISWEPYEGQNSGRKARTFVRFLHTGEALGWPGQLAACAASCAAILLVWTGFSLVWRRFFSRARD